MRTPQKILHTRTNICDMQEAGAHRRFFGWSKMFKISKIMALRFIPECKLQFKSSENVPSRSGSAWFIWLVGFVRLVIARPAWFVGFIVIGSTIWPLRRFARIGLEIWCFVLPPIPISRLARFTRFTAFESVLHAIVEHVSISLILPKFSFLVDLFASMVRFVCMNNEKQRHEKEERHDSLHGARA